MGAGRDAAAARGEHEPLRAVDDRDRVDLDAAEALDAAHQLVHRGRAPARCEALGRDGVPARGHECDLPHAVRPGVREPLEHVGPGQHADRRVAVGDEHGRARLQVVVDVVEAAHRLDDGQRIAHELGRRRLERAAAVAHRAVEQRALVHAAEHLAVVDHRQLRDRVALQQRDRVGDRLLRADAHERGHLARARRHELAGGRRARRVVEHAVDEHPVVVEDLREVGAAAVGEDHEHRLVGRQLLGDAQRGVQRHAARGADQDALEPRDPARRRERLAIGDAEPAVDDVAVERRRPEVLADALDEVGVHRLARVDRADRVGADDLQIGLALLEVAPGPVTVPPVPTPTTSTSSSSPSCSQISGPVLS